MGNATLQGRDDVHRVDVIVRKDRLGRIGRAWPNSGLMKFQRLLKEVKIGFQELFFGHNVVGVQPIIPYFFRNVNKKMSAFTLKLRRQAQFQCLR
jgi:hypothetical protein